MNSISMDPQALLRDFFQRMPRPDGTKDAEGAAAGSGDVAEMLARDLEHLRARAGQDGRFVSATIQQSVSFHLEAAFRGEDGREFQLTVDLEMKMQARIAAEAYGRQVPPPEEEYWSPEKTSDRIVDFAMGFLGAFQENHSEESQEGQIGGFFDLARAAIEKGFGEAKDLLGALYGQPAEDTWALVQEKLDDRQQSMISALTEGAE